ncbi:MAG: protein-disulfide reductase DsbD domain-containing protein [Salinibacter sp.]
MPRFPHALTPRRYVSMTDGRPSTRQLLRGLLIAALLVGAGPAAHLHAQTGGDLPGGTLQPQSEADSTRPSSSADLVSTELRLAARPVPAGQAVDVALVARVREGWHINAHRPTFDYLIGTSVRWAGGPDLQVTGTRYPEPKALRLDFAGEAIDVYEGKAVISATVRPAPTAAPGERRLAGRLRVQACNDRTCLRPSTVRAQLSVPVAEAQARALPTGAAAFESAPTEPGGGSTWAFLRRYGALLAGGVLALGTVLVIVVYSWAGAAPTSE